MEKYFKDDVLLIKNKKEDKFIEAEVLEHFGNILRVKINSKERAFFVDECDSIIKMTTNYDDEEEGVYLGTVQADGSFKEEE